MLESIMARLEHLKQELADLYQQYDDCDNSHHKQSKVSSLIASKTEELESLKESLKRFGDAKSHD